jgi:hypothetical protein
MITVPDDIAPEDYDEWVQRYLDTDEGSSLCDPDPTITGSVDGFDIEYDIVDAATLPPLIPEPEPIVKPSALLIKLIPYVSLDDHGLSTVELAQLILDRAKEDTP